MAGEEKTEKATPKKRKDTRKKGEVLQSKEVAVAVFVVGIFAFLAIFGNYMFQMLLNFMEQSMSSIDKTGNTVEFAMSVFWKVAIICVCTVGPILAVGVVLSVLPVIVQTKGLFSMEAMKPKFSRLNPFTGIKRLFSMQALVGLVKGLIENTVLSGNGQNKRVQKADRYRCDKDSCIYKRNGDEPYCNDIRYACICGGGRLCFPVVVI